MVSKGSQKWNSRRMAKGQRSLPSTNGGLKLPQKMVHAVDQHHKEGLKISQLCLLSKPQNGLPVRNPETCFGINAGMLV